MGGGGLRILPHKTWHVWRRDNIERVLKDERTHEEKRFDMDVKERRREQERRAQQLTAKGPATTQTQVKHVNLFELEEVQARGRDGTQDKKEKKKETLQRYGQLSWYAQPEKARKALTSRQERQKKRNLELADPLREMRPKEEQAQRLVLSLTLLEEEKEGRCRRNVVRAGPGGSDIRKYSGNYDYLSTSRDSKERNRLCRAEVEEEGRADEALKKHSKYRAKKRKREHCRNETSLEDLRQERKDREASERRRAEKLVYG
uniref:CBF1-interacting co-repressor CIR N-terminal domain-containing protein n=1 Tax=Peronospora matthiolae TaxID=2874970 RepID=A0AAV1UQP6_9STRA